MVGRIEKIEVRYLGLPDDVTLIMNKGISTPYNCAQREYIPTHNQRELTHPVSLLLLQICPICIARNRCWA